MRDVLDRFRVVDLTHPLDEKAPTWSGGCGFRLEVKLDYDQGLRVQSLKCHAGVGTHMDAPSHFFEHSWNCADIPLENCIVPAFVLHLKEKQNPDLFVSCGDLLAFEKRHGKISPNSLVFVSTGWDRFWTEPDRYRNVDKEGRMHFPGISKEAAELLLERGVVGIGIDTLSPDGSNNGVGADAYPVHQILLGARKYILENVANLEAMPPSGAFAIAFPMKSRFATESTARVAGLISL